MMDWEEELVCDDEEVVEVGVGVMVVVGEGREIVVMGVGGAWFC